MATDEKPSRNFLTKLYAKIKELAGDKLSQEDFNAAVSQARAHAGGKAKAEKSKMASESLSAYIDRVQCALSDWFRNKWGGVSVFTWAREVFTDYVISCSNIDGKFYQISYSTQNDEIQFGDPVEVVTAYVPVGANELALLCADGHGMRLFNELFSELNFAEPPDWIPYLPKPGKYNSPRYGEIVITEERNQNFVDNFSNAVYQEKLPIDAEHETQLSGACGWIVEMRQNDDGSVDAKVDWTDRGETLIENDRFKYFSPSWFEKWTDPASEETYNDVAIGGALTTRPFFKEKALRPLVANERGLSVYDGTAENLNSGNTVILNFTALTPVTESPEGAHDMNTPAAPTAQEFNELKTRVDTAEGKVTAAEGKAEEYRQAAEKATNDLKLASDRISALEKDQRAARFNEKAKGWVGDRAAHVDQLEFIVAHDEKGEESDRFKKYCESQDAAAKQLSESGLLNEIGGNAQSVGDTAVEKVNAKVTALREKDDKLSHGEAMQRVFAEDRGLYEQYARETTVKV